MCAGARIDENNSFAAINRRKGADPLANCARPAVKEGGQQLRKNDSVQSLNVVIGVNLNPQGEMVAELPGQFVHMDIGKQPLHQTACCKIDHAASIGKADGKVVTRPVQDLIITSVARAGGGVLDPGKQRRHLQLAFVRQGLVELVADLGDVEVPDHDQIVIEYLVGFVVPALLYPITETFELFAPSIACPPARMHDHENEVEAARLKRREVG